MVYMSQEEAQIRFAKEAAKDFAEHSEHISFGSAEPGSFLALRWGLGGDCVLVLKLDEDFIPTNYQQLVKQLNGR
jgi:hypothetical protein